MPTLASHAPAEETRDPLALAGETLARLDERGLRRFLLTIEGAQDPEITIGGRSVLCLCSNNYLGLANDRRLGRAAIDAIEHAGVGAGASRLISGNMTAHEALER